MRRVIRSARSTSPAPTRKPTGSTYTAEVNTTTSDLINVTGAATIQGGTTVSVLAAPGLYTVGHRYTILTASAGVTGTYTTLTDNAPFVDFQLAYDLNNVYLDVIMSSVSFQQVAQTPNQFAAAGGITSLGAGNPVFDAVLPLSADQARHAFDLLSGEIHASVLTMLLEQSRFIRDSIGGRLRQFVGGPAALFAPQIATRELGGETALAYADGRPQAGAGRDRARAGQRAARFVHRLGAELRQLGPQRERRQCRRARPHQWRFPDRHRQDGR